jgi:serine/threonine protein kinase
MTEIESMRGLKHDNIVNMIEYRTNAVIEKPNGRKNTVACIVLELSSGGEVFDYVKVCGGFNERVCRFYFRQFINGLSALHRKGITHRDLKLENLLFDENFNLKIADFGFAAPLYGRDGSGKCTTPLGTVSYKAPEIHAELPY